MKEFEIQRDFLNAIAIANYHGFAIAEAWLEKGGKDSPQIVGKALNLPSNPVPELKWLHAIPNGDPRGSDSKSRAIVGNRLKQSGVRRGIPDLFLPCGSQRLSKGFCGQSRWPGLYLELKAGKGQLSEFQREFRGFALAQGYAFAEIRSVAEGFSLVKIYFEGTESEILSSFGENLSI